jgi:cell division protein ZapA
LSTRASGQAASAKTPAPAIALQIFDRDYKLACPSEQQPALQAAARLLDGRMRELKAADKMLTLDRLAVLAALTIAQELLGKDEKLSSLSESLSAELKRMNETLDGVLRAA